MSALPKGLDLTVAKSFADPLQHTVASFEQLAGVLSSVQRGHDKEGSYWVPAKFNGERRLAANVEYVSLLVLDVDNKSASVTLEEAAERIRLAGLHAILHTTHSHAPEQPRFRVIVEPDRPVPPELVRNALRELSERLGLQEHIDAACMEPSRLYYLPRCPAGAEHLYRCEYIAGDCFSWSERAAPANSSQGNVLDFPAFRNAGRLFNQDQARVLANLAGTSLAETAENRAEVEGLLARIDPDCDYPQWRDVIWAIASLDWDSGPGIAEAWSRRSPGHWDTDAKAQRTSGLLQRLFDDYEPLREDAISLRTLRHLASQGTPGASASAGGIGGLLEAPSSLPGAMPRRRIRILTRDDLDALPDPEWIVDNLLPETGLVAIYGAPACGKTFLALDLAVTISEGGGTWFGLRAEQRPVLYVALEGQGGFPLRVRAWEAKNSRAVGLRYVMDELDVRDPADVGALLWDIEQLQLDEPPVIFVDTLNRAAPGMDENSSAEMGAVIAQLSALSARTGGLVVFVHHSGKDPKAGLRGHSSLLAAVDVAIEVKRRADDRVWRIEKSKDADDGAEGSFLLESVSLGISSEGKQLASCVVEPLARPLPMSSGAGASKPKRKLGKHQQAVIEEINRAIQAGEPTKVKDVVSRLVAKERGEPAQTRRNVTRAIQTLLKSGMLDEGREGGLTVKP